MKAALLIVDMQKGCKNIDSQRTIERAIEYINYTSNFFRKYGQTVVVIQDLSVGEDTGPKDFEMLDEIEVADTDIIVHKEQCNAFFGTNLDQILKEKGIELVVVCGYHAENCVLFTYNGASELGYTAAILQNGIAGSNDQDVQNVQLKRSVVSYDVLELILKN